MSHNSKHYFKQLLTFFLFTLSFCVVITGCKTTQKTSEQTKAPAENTKQQLSDSSIKEQIKKFETMIEEITGRKYDKSKTEFKIVDRETLRNILFEEELPGQLRLKKGMGEDLIKRNLEVSTQKRSQRYIARYSNLKDILYIVPENIGPVSNFYEIKDEDRINFVFLVIAHEMVHALDDQDYDFLKILAKCDGAEQVQAFGAVIDGSAAYVTKKIADRLNISGHTYIDATKSSLIITDETSGLGKQNYDYYFTKGAKFLETVINEKGLEGFNIVFTTPPTSTRQIFFPEEYLNPPAIAGIDCKKLLDKIKDKLPTEGMRSRVTTLGTSMLQTALVTQGIDKSEAGPLCSSLLNGVAYNALKPALKPSVITMEILNFKNGEDAAKYYSLTKKLQDSKEKQIKASLSTTINLIADEEIKQDGFSLLRYKKAEVKAENDEAVTIGITAIIDGVFVSLGYVNIDGGTKENLIDMMNLIYEEQLKLKQI